MIFDCKANWLYKTKQKNPNYWCSMCLSLLIENDIKKLHQDVYLSHLCPCCVSAWIIWHEHLTWTLYWRYCEATNTNTVSYHNSPTSYCIGPKLWDAFLPSGLAVPVTSSGRLVLLCDPASLRLATESLRKFVGKAEVYVNCHEIRRWKNKTSFVSDGSERRENTASPIQGQFSRTRQVQKTLKIPLATLVSMPVSIAGCLQVLRQLVEPAPWLQWGSNTSNTNNNNNNKYNRLISFTNIRQSEDYDFLKVSHLSWIRLD